MGLINGGFGFALGGEIWLGAFWLFFVGPPGRNR